MLWMPCAKKTSSGELLKTQTASSPFTLAAVAAVSVAALVLAVPVSARAQDAALPAPTQEVQGSEQQDKPVSALAQQFPAFADFERNGGIIEYLGRSGTLESFMLLGPDKSLKTVYVTPDNAMIMGILIDAQGRNLTAPQLVAYRKRLSGDQSAVPGAENSTLSKAEKIYAGVEKSAWVVAGSDSAPYIYMFMNVNCDHCKAMFTALAPLVTAGKLQIRLVPFGAAAANRDGGAALLSVRDPFAAWQAYIKGDTAALGKDKIAAGTLEKIAANTAFVGENKLPGPPFSIYRRPADGVVTALVGPPANTLTLLADLLPPEMPPAPPPSDGAPAPAGGEAP